MYLLHANNAIQIFNFLLDLLCISEHTVCINVSSQNAQVYCKRRDVYLELSQLEWSACFVTDDPNNC